MKKFLNKFLSSKQTEESSSATKPGYIDGIIKDIENKPLALSSENVLYAGLNELGGFYYFQTVVVGTLKIKVKQGAKLTLKSKDQILTLDSDMLELQSDHTDKSDRFVSKIDFCLHEEDVTKIDRKNIESLVLEIKNNTIDFKVISSKTDEEE